MDAAANIATVTTFILLVSGAGLLWLERRQTNKRIKETVKDLLKQQERYEKARDLSVKIVSDDSLSELEHIRSVLLEMSIQLSLVRYIFAVHFLRSHRKGSNISALLKQWQVQWPIAKRDKPNEG